MAATDPTTAPAIHAWLLLEVGIDVGEGDVLEVDVVEGGVVDVVEERVVDVVDERVVEVAEVLITEVNDVVAGDVVDGIDVDASYQV